MMPLFGKKKKDDHSMDSLPNADQFNDNSMISASTLNDESQSHNRKPTFSFQCQLAHGSPTGLITGFKNIKELFAKIAECFEIDADDIIFCTLNTHKIDMDQLLGSHIGLDDFIFVHIKGQKKEIDIYKSDDSLGLTITDNGAGRAFIKRIRVGSQISKLAQGLIDVGDHIEKIDNEIFIGKRHYDVAKKLRSIDVGTKFTIRLISPEKSIYSNIQCRSEFPRTTPTNIVNGKKTLRLTDIGVFEEDVSSNSMEMVAIDAITRHVERALGISDSEMAQLILDVGKKSRNPAEFINRLNDELGECLFPELLLHDCWSVIIDAKRGILTGSTQSIALSSTTSGFTNNVYEDAF